MRRKLGHVTDALGKGDGGGPASKQARKPLGGLKARVVVVEGEEDAGAAPQGIGDGDTEGGQERPRGAAAQAGEGR